MEGGGVLESGDLMRKMMNLQFPSNIESDRSLGQDMECLVGRIHR